MGEGSSLEEIVERLRAVQQEFEQELDRLLREKRSRFRYSWRRGRVIFERQVKKLLREQKVGLWRYLRQAPLASFVSSPVIYAMIVPIVLLDVTVTLYQHICFRLYRVPRVRRLDYLYIDRHYLPYLNLLEKVNCIYCGYANGMIEYSREVIARTEQFWCPIKHARRTPDPHRRTEKFVDYGDAAAWREKLEEIRRDWKDAS